jgi:hypothetical protein
MTWQGAGSRRLAPKGKSRRSPCHSPNAGRMGQRTRLGSRCDRDSCWPRDRVAANDQLENEHPGLKPGRARHAVESDRARQGEGHERQGDGPGGCGSGSRPSPPTARRHDQ